MDGPRAAGVIAVILKGYPRLSETFIAQELHALEERGLALALYSLRHPTDRETHPIHAEIRAPVVLPARIPAPRAGRVLRALAPRAPPPGIPRRGRGMVARFPARSDAQPDSPARAGIRAGGRAAAQRRRSCTRISCTRRHRSTRYAALLRGLPWSCSAHAKDIWTTPEWEKREKLDACAWMTTCTEVNARHLRELARPGTSRRPQLPRDRHAAVSAARLRAHARQRRQRPATPGHDPRGGPRRRQERLRRSAARARANPARAALAVHAHRRRSAAAASSRTRRAASASPSASNGAARRRKPRCSPRIARRTSSRCHAASAPTATATDCPMCCSKRRARSCACVSTRVSGIPELIEHDVTGLLVEPRAIGRARGGAVDG